MATVKKKLLLGLVLAALVVVPAVFGVRFYRTLPAEPLRAGDQAPAFDAEPVNVDRPVPTEGPRAVLFLSPTCPSCNETLHLVTSFRNRHPEWFEGPASLHWILVSTGDAGDTQRLAESTTLPLYRDSDRRASDAMHRGVVPYLVLIDESGIVRHSHTGVWGTAQETALASLHERKPIQ